MNLGMLEFRLKKRMDQLPHSRRLIGLHGIDRLGEQVIDGLRNANGMTWTKLANNYPLVAAAWATETALHGKSLNNGYYDALVAPGLIVGAASPQSLVALFQDSLRGMHISSPPHELVQQQMYPAVGWPLHHAVLPRAILRDLIPELMRELLLRDPNLTQTRSVHTSGDEAQRHKLLRKLLPSNQPPAGSSQTYRIFRADPWRCGVVLFLLSRAARGQGYSGISGPDLERLGRLLDSVLDDRQADAVARRKARENRAKIEATLQGAGAPAPAPPCPEEDALEHGLRVHLKAVRGGDGQIGPVRLTLPNLQQGLLDALVSPAPEGLGLSSRDASASLMDLPELDVHLGGQRVGSADRLLAGGIELPGGLAAGALQLRTSPSMEDEDLTVLAGLVNRLTEGLQLYAGAHIELRSEAGDAAPQGLEWQPDGLAAPQGVAQRAAPIAPSLELSLIGPDLRRVVYGQEARLPEGAPLVLRLRSQTRMHDLRVRVSVDGELVGAPQELFPMATCWLTQHQPLTVGRHRIELNVGGVVPPWGRLWLRVVPATDHPGGAHVRVGKRSGGLPGPLHAVSQQVPLIAQVLAARELKARGPAGSELMVSASLLDPAGATLGTAEQLAVLEDERRRSLDDDLAAVLRAICQAAGGVAASAAAVTIEVRCGPRQLFTDMFKPAVAVSPEQLRSEDTPWDLDPWKQQSCWSQGGPDGRSLASGAALAGSLPEPLRSLWWEVERGDPILRAAAAETAIGAACEHVFGVNPAYPQAAPQLLGTLPTVGNTGDWDGALALVRAAARNGLTPAEYQQADSRSVPVPATLARLVNSGSVLPPDGQPLGGLELLLTLLLRAKALGLTWAPIAQPVAAGSVQAPAAQAAPAAQEGPPRWWAPAAQPWLALELGAAQQLPNEPGFLLTGPVDRPGLRWGEVGNHAKVRQVRPSFSSASQVIEPAETAAAQLRGPAGRFARGLLLARLAGGELGQSLWFLEEDLHRWRADGTQDFGRQLLSRAWGHNLWKLIHGPRRAIQNRPRGWDALGNTLPDAVITALDGDPVKELPHALRTLLGMLNPSWALGDDHLHWLMPACVDSGGVLPSLSDAAQLSALRGANHSLITAAVILRIAAHWKDVA